MHNGSIKNCLCRSCKKQRNSYRKECRQVWLAAYLDCNKREGIIDYEKEADITLEVYKTRFPLDKAKSQ